MSLAKIQMFFMAIIGFIEGILFFLIGLFNPNDELASIGLLWILILPIIFAIIGFFMGAIIALIYNLLAKWIGGVEVEIE